MPGKTHAILPPTASRHSKTRGAFGFPVSPALDGIGIYHGCLHIATTQKHLDGSDIPVGRQMVSKTVPKGTPISFKETIMNITDLEDTLRTKMDMEGAQDVWKQVPISKADGTPSFSIRQVAR